MCYNYMGDIVEKDYVNITTKTGIEKMELVASFNIETTKKICIIYKDKNNKYYAAKLDRKGDLDTNFTDEEKKVVKEVFEKIGDNND